MFECLKEKVKQASKLRKKTYGPLINGGPQRTFYLYPHHEEFFTCMGVVSEQPDLQTIKSYGIVASKPSSTHDELGLKCFYKFLRGLTSIHYSSGLNYKLVLPIRLYFYLAYEYKKDNPQPIIDGIYSVINDLLAMGNSVTISHSFYNKSMKRAEQAALSHIGKGDDYLL